MDHWEWMFNWTKTGTIQDEGEFRFLDRNLSTNNKMPMDGYNPGKSSPRIDWWRSRHSTPPWTVATQKVSVKLRNAVPDGYPMLKVIQESRSQESRQSGRDHHLAEAWRLRDFPVAVCFFSILSQDITYKSMCKLLATLDTLQKNCELVNIHVYIYIPNL